MFFVNLIQNDYLKIQVQRLVLPGSNFPLLGSFSFSQFRNLQHIDLSNSKIGEIHEDVFGHLPLESIVLSGNNIYSLPRLFTEGNGNLVSVDLSQNHLSDIQPGLFDSFTTLKYLNLKGNPLQNYITNAWYFCINQERGNLIVDLDSHQKIAKDLKVDQHSDEFCLNNPDLGGDSVANACSNDDGHLTCSGDVADLLCELRNMEFKSIVFTFPKDDNHARVENYHEAETDSYFQEVNGKGNLTKYLPELKLYGAKFDLASLDEYVGLRTEHVTIFADTIWISEPLSSPITFRMSLKGRVVALTEDIFMNMTRSQFFNVFEADQPVENWAHVEEIITDVGNTSFSIRKLGFMEIQKARIQQPRSFDSKVCTPRQFTVEEYLTDHNTSPDIFFDRVALNLLRIAVRTLAAKQSNNDLALEMVEHTMLKTYNPNIVSDKKAYILAQKLIKDKELIGSNMRNVPFYNIPSISDLAEIMYDRMSLYAANETILMANLSRALDRMADMNQHFEEARMTRELYFEMEWKVLDAIFTSGQMTWNWTFDASRENEQSIQDSINSVGEAMFEMQKNEIQQMIDSARATVESDQAVVDKLNDEIERYSIESTRSLQLQRSRLEDLNEAGETVDKEQETMEHEIDIYMAKQVIKLFAGIVTSIVGIVGAFATGNPAAAGAGINAGKKAAQNAKKIEELFENFQEMVETIHKIQELLEVSLGVDDIDAEIPEFNGDLALNISENWRNALENAYNLKSKTKMFTELMINAEPTLNDVGPATDGNVNPTPLKQALLTYSERGTQLIQESVNFADIMMKLADLAGDLKVAELDLSLAVQQVKDVEKMLEDLIADHEEYKQSNDQRRDEYQEKTDEFAGAFNDASEELKEQFRIEITELFNNFKEGFEASNKQYIERMNNLTAGLYTKVASVKQHSMVQRSMIVNLYQDFCDGLFYFSFADCIAEGNIPTMSDDFGTLLFKLKQLEWDAITSAEALPDDPENFQKVCNH